MLPSPVPVERRLNDPVAAHMRTDSARLLVGQSVQEALDSIRAQPPAGRIIYFYVVDAENRLCGVVPTRRLLLNPPERTLDEIMIREVVAIPETASVLEACQFFTNHRLLAFPVVNANRQLLGLVDVELYTDELGDPDHRARNDDLFQLIGVHLTHAQQTSPATAFCHRFPWLLANLVGGILAAFLSKIFEDDLQRTVALALFIPVVLALAESVSIQSVSLALQILRGTQPTLATIVRKLRAELLTGLLLGMASASAVAMIALVWLGQWRVAACLLGGIASGVTAAAVIGTAMPNLLRLFHREPQVAAGPIALALTDMVTLLAYFSLASSLLN